MLGVGESAPQLSVLRASAGGSFLGWGQGFKEQGGGGRGASVREPALENPQASLGSNLNGGGQASGSLFLPGSWAAQANPSSANHVMPCPFPRPWCLRAPQAGPRGQACISFLSHGNVCLASAPQPRDLGPLLVLKSCPGAGASSSPARQLCQGSLGRCA